MSRVTRAFGLLAAVWVGACSQAAPTENTESVGHEWGELAAQPGAAEQAAAVGDAALLAAPTQLNTFVLLASGQATLLDRSVVSGGNIGAAAGTGDSVTAWPDTKLALGKATLGQRIVLKDRAALGDVFATQITGPGTYTSLSPYAAPPAQPAISTFTAGTTPITVSTPTTLPAGNYGAVTVNSTLTLSGGTYQIQSLSLATNAVVQSSAATLLRVAGKITGGNFIRLRPTGVQPAANLRVVVAGSTEATGGVVLGTDAIVTGLILSRASFAADARFTATGVIAAKNVTTGTDAKISFASGFECNSDAGCNDANPCTTDACVDARCTHTALVNGSACPDDGNVCTSDSCQSGVCAHPALANGTACTSDNNECTTDACQAGACAHPALPNGTACTADNSECTSDICTSGACSHPALQDGTACTADDAYCTADVCGAGVCTHPLDSRRCGESDAAPAMVIQARWIYPNGQPIRSFSYQPTGTASPAPLGKAAKALKSTAPPAAKGHFELKNSAKSKDASPFSTFVADPPAVSRIKPGVAQQSLTPPPDDPQDTRTLQIRNASQQALGERVAYSISVRTWGMGNFAADSTIVAPSFATVLDPGATATETIDLVSHLLVRTPHMAAKADFVVGLHKITSPTTINPIPYAYVGVQGFYYNYSDDYQHVYTYGLERPPAGSAPAGQEVADGVVERYRNGVLGGDMFYPDGFYGDVPAADARAQQQTTFADRGHAVWGVRPSTHDVDPTTGTIIGSEPPLPPQGTGGSTEPYDPSTGPTKLCFRWPVSYIDKHTEAYPAVIAEPEWNGLVDFIPASYGIGDLYTADGTPIAVGQRLDELGCMPAQNLGKGNYLFRVYTVNLQHSGTQFEVEAAEPVDLSGSSFKIAANRALSLTLSLYIWAPGATFFVQNGYWSHTTNVAGIASHVMKRHFGGVDMGLQAKRYQAHVDDVDCDVVDPNDSTNCTAASFASVSHFSPSSGILFVDANADVWTHDARWKFVSAHELGHEVQDHASASLSVVYWFETGTDRSTRNTPRQVDPQSSLTPGIDDNCSCKPVDAANASHCIQSIEVSASAQSEGFGHFFASRLWNRVPGEDGYDGTCNFTYYKQVSSSDLVGSPQVFPVYVNCGTTYAHRDSLCNDVNITNHSDVEIAYGSELDWLTYFWQATTASSNAITLQQLLSAYSAALATNSPIDAELLISKMPSGIQATMTTIAHDTAVLTADQ